MRFIDEKGRVFGLINIFDLAAVILVVAVVIPGAMFQYKYIKEKSSALKKEELKFSHTYKHVRARAHLMPEVAGRIRKGDRLLNPYGNLQWEIEEIVSNAPVTVGVEKIAEMPSLRLVEIALKILCRVERDGALTAYGGEDLIVNLLVGAALTLTTDVYTASFTVVDVK